jgi:hypothetical protein
MRTLQEFIDLVCGRTGASVRYHEVPGRFGHSGPPSKRYLVRTLVDGSQTFAMLPRHIGEDEFFNDGLARQALQNLGLTPRDFGY